ncbi:MAG TPA: hypothetical protein VHT96_09985 [Clostridia bacterium]|nr:hypothetical protein [Clostridia bacterium]
MDKRALISEILPKLSQLGIAYTLEQGTDVAIACEFLDAGWGTGNKKIIYASSVYFDEAENTVYMWELTKETGSGFSFGGDSETSFQSGTTLFRKVKSIQYGPDGKAYEYTLDLGAIPKAFKETAKTHRWRFKTVLKREKASYPPGYVPPAGVNPQQDPTSAPPPPPSFHQYQPPALNIQSWNAAPPTPASDATGQANYMPEQKYGNPNGTLYAQGSKDKGGIKGVFFWIGLIILAISVELMFSYSKNSTIGWALAGGILVLLFVLRKALARKGCLVEIIVWVTAVIALFLIFAFTMGGPSGGGVINTDAVKEPSAEESQAGSNGTGEQSFNKEYSFPDGKGTFIIDVQSGGNDGPYTIVINGRFNNSGLPKGFKYDGSMTDEKIEIWPATDCLTFAICSGKDASKPWYISPTGVFTKYNPDIQKNELTEYTDFSCELSFSTRKDVLEFFDKNDMLQILWYNMKEVGLRDIEKRQDGTMSGTHNHEKAFGLHPPLADAQLPWAEVKKALGL